MIDHDMTDRIEQLAHDLAQRGGNDNLRAAAILQTILGANFSGVLPMAADLMRVLSNHQIAQLQAQVRAEEARIRNQNN